MFILRYYLTAKGNLKKKKKEEKKHDIFLNKMVKGKNAMLKKYKVILNMCDF